MLFTGSYEHTIDAKSRVAIPADIRKAWDPTLHGTAWYAVPWIRNVIRLYPALAFEKRAAEGFQSLTPSLDEAELQEALFGMTARLVPDSVGRIRLPDEVLKLTNMPSEVVLVGMGDRLEIRDRAAWQQGKADRLEALARLMEKNGGR